MAGKYNVNWTLEAKNQVDQILSYLRENFSEKECNDFLDLLFHFEKAITSFPKLFKESSVYKNCRLGIVHRHVTAIYIFRGKSITILTIIDNRSKLKK